jgi:hypothetical protein
MSRDPLPKPLPRDHPAGSTDRFHSLPSPTRRTTVIIIDAVLLPLVFNMGSSGGAAWMALPSPLVLLLSSIAAVVALQLFSRQEPL